MASDAQDQILRFFRYTFLRLDRSRMTGNQGPSPYLPNVKQIVVGNTDLLSFFVIDILTMRFICQTEVWSGRPVRLTLNPLE